VIGLDVDLHRHEPRTGGENGGGEVEHGDCSSRRAPLTAGGVADGGSPLRCTPPPRPRSDTRNSGAARPEGEEGWNGYWQPGQSSPTRTGECCWPCAGPGRRKGAG